MIQIPYLYHSLIIVSVFEDEQYVLHLVSSLLSIFLNSKTTVATNLNPFSSVKRYFCKVYVLLLSYYLYFYECEIVPFFKMFLCVAFVSFLFVCLFHIFFFPACLILLDSSREFFGSSLVIDFKSVIFWHFYSFSLLHNYLWFFH